jgi:hypothetical protein
VDVRVWVDQVVVQVWVDRVVVQVWVDRVVVQVWVDQVVVVVEMVQSLVREVEGLGRQPVEIGVLHERPFVVCF